MLKLVFSILALIAGFVFGLIIPGSGVEGLVVPVLTAAAGAYGLMNWRQNYDLAKEWFASKTVVGALLVAVPILLLVILPFAGVTLPPAVVTILTVLILGGGGTALWGIFDAIEKKTNTRLSK